MRSFKINEFITLKLEKGNTNIYVNNQLFRQCKYLLINIPRSRIEDYNSKDSIDEAAEYYSNQLEGKNPSEIEIPPETEFWGHCSNLQAWAENDYNPKLLHSTLSLPLLKKLTEVGDSKARQVFKEEFIKRLEINDHNITTYLIKEGLLRYFNKQELEYLADINDHPAIKLYAELIDFPEEIEQNLEPFQDNEGKLDYFGLMNQHFEKTNRYIYFKQFIGKPLFENERKEIRILIFLSLIFKSVSGDQNTYEAYIYGLLYSNGNKIPYFNNIIYFLEDNDLVFNLKSRDHILIAHLIMACKKNDDMGRAKLIFLDFLNHTPNKRKMYKVLELFFMGNLKSFDLFKDFYIKLSDFQKKTIIPKLIQSYNKEPSNKKLQFLTQQLKTLNWTYRIQNPYIFLKSKKYLQFDAQSKNFIEHKVLLVGLEDSGKTTIQKLLTNQDIASMFNLLPSKGLNVQELKTNNRIFYIWDLAGNKRAREHYLRRNYVLPETNEIIYCINLLKQSRFSESLNYLSSLLTQYEKYCNENLISKEKATISILFHKMDPQLMNSALIRQNAEYLSKKISELDISIEYRIFYTSIHNFCNRNYARVLKDNKSKELWPIIADLFSTI
jgi:GTPase SAR1 family protein